MFGLFRAKPLLDDDSALWLRAAFRWARVNLQGTIDFERRELAAPSNRFFPDRIASPAELAPALFARVKRLAGLETWPCELVEQEADPDPRVARTWVIQNWPQSPAGTFSVRPGEDAKAVITYNPALLRDPERLVATLAHELAHYLSLVIREPPPGGDEFREHATDLIAVYLGFGVFLLNSAFKFRQFTDTASGTQGWSVRRLGYLAPRELAYVLAIFCLLKRIPAAEVAPLLGDPQRGFFRKAMRELARQDQAIGEIAKIITEAPTA